MTGSDLVAFKCLVAALIDMVTEAAAERGVARDQIFRLLSAESLELAVRMHRENNGSDDSFVRMAKESLALVRTGARMQ